MLAFDTIAQLSEEVPPCYSMQRCTPYAAAVRHANCTAERSRDSVLTGSHGECGALHRRASALLIGCAHCTRWRCSAAVPTSLRSSDRRTTWPSCR